MPDPIVDPTYRYATQRFVLDGSTIDFNINFADGYISRDYVDCYYETISDLSVEPIDTSLITWVSDDHIRIPDAALQPNTKRLLVKRWTEKGYALVNYTDDAIINEANLDKDARQAIHDIAEMIDYLSDLNMKWESLNERVLDLLEQVNDALDAIQEAIDRLDNLKYTDLKDTPNTLQPNGIPLVNGAGTAIGWTDAASIVAAGGGGGGAEAFTDLDDTPSSYTGQNNKLVVVSGSGLAFATASDALGAGGLDVVTEAPEDGNEYVRKDGAWAQKTNLIDEAPIDGQEYVRKNGDWEAKTDLIDEAPMDGQQYARQDGGWEVVEGGGSGGVDTFIELTDTPSSYTGIENIPVINNTTDGLKFVDSVDFVKTRLIKNGAVNLTDYQIWSYTNPHTVTIGGKVTNSAPFESIAIGSYINVKYSQNFVLGTSLMKLGKVRIEREPPFSSIVVTGWEEDDVYVGLFNRNSPSSSKKIPLNLITGGSGNKSSYILTGHIVAIDRTGEYPINTYDNVFNEQSVWEFKVVINTVRNDSVDVTQDQDIEIVYSSFNKIVDGISGLGDPEFVVDATSDAESGVGIQLKTTGNLGKGIYYSGDVSFEQYNRFKRTS